MARQNQGIKQTRNLKKCTSCQWMDEGARKLRRMAALKRQVFRRRWNETILPSDLTLTASEKIRICGVLDSITRCVLTWTAG